MVTIDTNLQKILGYISPITTTLPHSVEEIRDQPLFLNPHTKLDFSSDKPYFFCIPPMMNSSGLKPSLISSMKNDDKLGFPAASHERIYKLIIDFN